VRKVKEEKENLLKRRKEIIKELTAQCTDKLAGTKFDRFFVEEFVKKIKGIEELEEIVNLLKNSEKGDQETFERFETLISSKGSKAEQERDKLR